MYFVHSDNLMSIRNTLGVQVLMYRQDDPSKCTAAKLVRFGLAEPVRFIKYNTLLLDPFCEIVISNQDIGRFKRVCAVDCSWEKASESLLGWKVLKRGACRRLPALLAGNPTNYSKMSRLSSAEALAASLFILGQTEMAKDILHKFKWGHTFFELNLELLQDYSNAVSPAAIIELEKEYFPHLY
jgi:pre-rRNA-processing protein TSR3